MNYIKSCRPQPEQSGWYRPAVTCVMVIYTAAAVRNTWNWEWNGYESTSRTAVWSAGCALSLLSTLVHAVALRHSISANIQFHEAVMISLMNFSLFFRFRVSRSGFAILCGCFPHMWYKMWRDEILARFCTCVSNITTITAEFNIVTTAGNLSF